MEPHNLGNETKIPTMLNSGEEITRIRLGISEMEKAFDYIAEKFRTARGKIDHAAFSPEIRGFVEYSKAYREAVEALINKNKIYYRYVAGVGPDTERKGHRLNGIRRRLERRSNISESDSRYSAKIFFADSDYNGLNFFLFDNNELAIYVPGAEGEPGVGLFTHDKTDIDAYIRNFSGLWDKARPANSLDAVQRIEGQLVSLQPAFDVERVGRLPWPAHRKEVEIVLNACRRFQEVARVLTNRSRGGEPRLELTNEYAVQDLLQATLRSHIQHSVQEDPIGKVAGTRSSRADISIEQLGVLIEVKFARSGDDQKRIFDELSRDLVLYTQWHPLRTLVFLIYNHTVLSDPQALLLLTRSHEIRGVRFDVEIILV